MFFLQKLMTWHIYSLFLQKPGNFFIEVMKDNEVVVKSNENQNTIFILRS
jgi:hypothetical protein